jgi:hypothetical protein
MVKAIVDDDDKNVKVLEEWQEAAFEHLGPGIGQVMGYNDLCPEPYLSSGEWLVDAIAHYATHAEKNGLALPDLDDLFEGAADMPVSLDALYTKLDVEPSWWDDLMPGAGALDQPRQGKRMNVDESLDGVEH